MEEGNYTLTAQKSGYEGYITNISILANETKTLNLTLFPEDNTPPSITNLFPSDGSAIDVNKPTISANYSDERGIDLSSIILKIDNVNVMPTKNSSSISYTITNPLSNGKHSVYLEVRDNSANKNLATKSWNFYINSNITTVHQGNIKATFDYTGNGYPSIDLISNPQGNTSGALNLFADIKSNGISFAYVKIEINYSESDIQFGYNESTLKIYYWNNSEWKLAENSSLDTNNNKIYANVSHLTIFTAIAQQKEKGNLTGVVKDERGNIVQDANIIVEGTPLTTTTNVQGVYSFFDVPIGNYNVKANKTNYTDIKKSTLIIANQTTIFNFTFQYSVPVLYIEYMTLSSYNPRADDILTISAKVVNVGTSVKNVSVKIKIDDSVIKETKLNISKGNYDMADTKWKAIEGNHTIYILINDVIKRTQDLFVNKTLPNIKIENITFSNNAPVEGDKVEIVVKLKNYGGDASFKIEIKIDGILLKNDTITIKKGETKDYVISWNAEKGTKNISVEVSGDEIEKIVKSETIKVSEKPSSGGFISGFEFLVLVVAIVVLIGRKKNTEKH